MHSILAPHKICFNEEAERIKRNLVNSDYTESIAEKVTNLQINKVTSSSNSKKSIATLYKSPKNYKMSTT